MAKKPFDVLVYIGRFQPYHLGHKAVVDRALEMADLTIVLVGSSYSSRSPRNPFFFETVKDMILSTHNVREPNLVVAPIGDHPYNDVGWMTQVRKQVERITKSNLLASIGQYFRIGLIGMKKDHTSYYLDMFPEWESVPVNPWSVGGTVINATDIRAAMFEYGYIQPIVPGAVERILKSYIADDSYFAAMQKEYQFLKEHAKQWASAPYPPTFNTVDAVVEQSGYILMVSRRAEPGKGLLALPGGYVGQYETLEDSMLRELKEETQIDVPVKVLRGNIKRVKTYDYPYRSTRGRIITQAFHIELPDGKLPRVKGADDAEKATWVPLAGLEEGWCFEDHYHIVRDILGF